MLRSVDGDMRTAAAGVAGVKDVVHEFTTDSFNGWVATGPGSQGYSLRAHHQAAYDALYTRHVWVGSAINKLGNAHARLPLKTYLRGDAGRPEAPEDHPYRRILDRPSPTVGTFAFWQWVTSVAYIFGESFARKHRDPGGRPVELEAVHPTRVSIEGLPGEPGRWQITRPDGRREPVSRRDLVHFRLFNPRAGLNLPVRGVSPLELLRITLAHEWSALRAQTALWSNGARPSVFLSHPSRLSKGAYGRLRADWANTHTGVDNWGTPAILEEGLTAEKLTLSADEMQYVSGRKLNREEVCGALDIPPPVLHILDRATFSNITEQMRSMYRDTMAPRLTWLESILEVELRDGRLGADGEPDFGDGVYGEFLLDGVLRGDFEQRVSSYAAAINTGWMMPSEVRSLENLPAVDGAEVLLVNGTLRPIDEAGNAGDASGPGREDPAIEGMRTLLGRLGRVEGSVYELEVDALAADLDAGTRELLDVELEQTKMIGGDVAGLRERLKGWTHAAHAQDRRPRDQGPRPG